MAKKKALKIAGLIALAIVALIIIFLFRLVINGGLGFNVGICFSKMDLSEEEINELDSIASQFIDYLNDGKSEKLYEGSSSNLKTLESVQSLDEISLAVRDNFGYFEEKNLLEIYKINVKPGSHGFCTDDLSDKKNTYIIPSIPGTTNMVLAIHEITTNVSVLYSFMVMEEEDNELKLRSFIFQYKELNGKDADYLINLAAEQLEKGNNRNALLFYAASMEFLINNEIIHTEYVNVINKQINSIEIEDLPLSGEALFWTTDSGNTYEIYRINVLLLQNEIGLEFSYVTKTDLNDIDKLEVESLEIARYIKNNFPEYQEAFDALAIQSAGRIPGPTDIIETYINVYYFEEL